MIKKFYISSLFLLCSTMTSAGDMGEIPKSYSTTPFIIGEGNVSWMSYQKEIINNVYSTQLNKIWGGRFAAGFTRTYRTPFSFTGEMGYGYYGRVRTNFINSVNNNYFAIDGLDLLAGFLYAVKDIDLFFKAGAIVANKRVKGSLDLSQAYPGGVVSGFSSYNSNYTQVLPTLKTGGLYNFNANVALTLSYMHVFGSSPSLFASGNVTTTPLSITSNRNIHDQNPSFDSFLFGIQYNFT